MQGFNIISVSSLSMMSYLCWCIRFLCQQMFHSCRSDSETSFINEVPRKWNIPISIEVVHTSRFLMPLFVRSSTNFWNLAFWNKTSRAWTGTKVANHGKECSTARRPSEMLSTTKEFLHSLFWIVSQICKYPWIEASRCAIGTWYYDPVFICIQKVIVK